MCILNLSAEIHKSARLQCWTGGLGPLPAIVERGSACRQRSSHRRCMRFHTTLQSTADFMARLLMTRTNPISCSIMGAVLQG